MLRSVGRYGLLLIPLALALGLLASGHRWTTATVEGQAVSSGPPSTAKGEWPHYTADLSGSRYSPLDQINGTNFSKLEVAWRFKTDSLGPFPEYKLEGTPLMIGDTLYTTAGTRRSVIALDARTGELKWVYSLREGRRAALSPRQLSGRGVSYWTDGKGDNRVIYVTTGYQVVELNAATGQPVTSFGRNGILDLKQGVVVGNEQQINLESGEIGIHATPTIVGDIMIIGAAMREGATVSTYLPVETPTSDFYGGHRPGNNLFAESIVAVDIKTGQRKWHYQLVHHPLWNFDNCCASLLADIVVDGKPIKALAQPSKIGWLYVLDRLTGQPVWPIEEREVPQSDVPGEKSAKTQPHVTKPPPYARTFMRIPEDVIDFTPALRQQALERLKLYKYAPSPFMPPILGNLNGPLLGAIGASTATNWPGSAYDPETHTVFAQAGNLGAQVRSLVAPPQGFSDIRYVSGYAGRPFREVMGPGDCCAADAGKRTRDEAPPPPPSGGTPPQDPGLTVQGLPIPKPPYGVLSAVNLDRGELTWQVPHGDTPDNIRNHPALRGMTIPKTGQPGTQGVGLMVTKTLAVMGDPQITAPPGRPRGAMLRAYDKKTGAEVGAVLMPAPQSGSPMTYAVNGKQYIVVAVSGGAYSGEYLAFTLPDSSAQ